MRTRHPLLLAILLALATTALIAFWILKREQPPELPSPAAPAPRAAFDGTQPLTFAVHGSRENSALSGWIKDELEYWLSRAPEVSYVHSQPNASPPDAFTLRVGVESAVGAPLELTLLAPDGVLERRSEVRTNALSRFELAQQLGVALPAFLGLHSAWGELIGTSNPDAYEQVVRARELLRAPADGDSQRHWSEELMRVIGALEKVTRTEPHYARAWSTLGLAYLQVEGKDFASLAELASNSADRALELEPRTAEAHAVLGSVQYRNAQWLAAHTHLTQALDMQPNDSASLEALACLLADAGLAAQALPLAERALQVRPGSTSAYECWSYLQVSVGQPAIREQHGPLPFEVARLRAVTQILDGDVPAARRTLEASLRHEGRRAPWLASVLAAANDTRHTAAALKALTAAASEGRIDPITEALGGLSLRSSDFVLNRFMRLQRARQYAPLRLLWIPQAAALRRHPNFEEVMQASNLSALWQRQGKPDVCAREPGIVVCR